MRWDYLWAKDWPGRPLKLFGPSHLAALFVVTALNLSWLWLGPQLNENARLWVRVTMAVILLVNEGLWHIWNLTTGQWNVKELLPFHLCSVMVYLSAFLLVTRNYTAYEFCYFMGIGGASQALLTPDAGRYDFPHEKYWATMVSHGLIVTAPLYMTLVEGYRPTGLSLLVVAGGMLLYTALVGMVNWRLGSNYLYIARKPATASLIDVLGPWPWYILALMGIAVAMMLLLYLPFLFF